MLDTIYPDMKYNLMYIIAMYIDNIKLEIIVISIPTQ